MAIEMLQRARSSDGNVFARVDRDYNTEEFSIRVRIKVDSDDEEQEDNFRALAFAFTDHILAEGL